MASFPALMPGSLYIFSLYILFVIPYVFDYTIASHDYLMKIISICLKFNGDENMGADHNNMRRVHDGRAKIVARS
jgi:hypothetical protein